MAIAKAVQASYNWKSFTEREREFSSDKHTTCLSLTHKLSGFTAPNADRQLKHLGVNLTFSASILGTEHRLVYCSTQFSLFLVVFTHIHPHTRCTLIPYGDQASEIQRNKSNSGISRSENNISRYITNELRDRSGMEIENYISLFPSPDLLRRFSGFNSPGYARSQRATVNKQDYPFEHASKSYHIGAERTGGEGKTTARWLTVAETWADMAAEKIPISVFAFLLFSGWWRQKQRMAEAWSTCYTNAALC